MGEVELGSGPLVASLPGRVFPFRAEVGRQVDGQSQGILECGNRLWMSGELRNQGSQPWLTNKQPIFPELSFSIWGHHD